MLLLDEADERVEFEAAGAGERVAFGLCCLLQAEAGALDRLQHAGFVEGLEQVVDGVDVEGAHRVLVEGGGEDDLRQPVLVLDELLEHGESVEAGHLHIEKDEVGLVLADELDGLDAVCALGHDFDAAGGVEQILQLFARELLIVDDERGDGRRRGVHE